MKTPGLLRIRAEMRWRTERILVLKPVMTTVWVKSSDREKLGDDKEGVNQPDGRSKKGEKGNSTNNFLEPRKD
jgi:hypothetical protein